MFRGYLRVKHRSSVLSTLIVRLGVLVYLVLVYTSHTVITVSVQYDGGSLPNIIRLAVME